MNPRIAGTIAAQYALDIQRIIPGPRLIIAETARETYFAKLIQYTKYSPKVVQSRLVLKLLYESDLANINYPIPNPAIPIYSPSYVIP